MSVMKCDHCEKPAVVHEVTIRNGLKQEVHLCAQHAQEHGVELPSPTPLNQLLSQFTAAVAGAGRPTKAVANKTCSGCGLTFAQFKSSGKLGCGECYATFEQALASLIERAQAGASHHTGKSPRAGTRSLDRTLLIKKLMKELESAVATEQYERAATLRDKLRRMETSTDDTPSSSSG